MANRTGSQNTKHSGINTTFIGAVFLGICILIAGLNIGGNIKKLNKTLSEKDMASTQSVNVPSEMNIANKTYLTEDEAGAYLNLPTEKIVNLITAGEITEYVKTETGYSISVSVLDAWFDNEAYQTKLKSKAVQDTPAETAAE